MNRKAITFFSIAVIVAVLSLWLLRSMMLIGPEEWAEMEAACANEGGIWETHTGVDRVTCVSGRLMQYR